LIKRGDKLLAIKDIYGNEELLTNIKGLEQVQKVNGDKTLSYFVIPDESNEHSFGMVEGESIVEFDNEEYVIKDVDENGVGHKSIKQAGSVHRFFNDMINTIQYKVHNGSMTFSTALSFVFENTSYEFNIIDSFNAESFENFGSENCLSLFQKVLKKYNAEFYIIGNQVYLKKEIGEKTDIQFRYAHNIKTISKQISTKNLATVIRGYGGTPDEETGEYPIEVEYRSPNVDKFGELHADPVYDERITTVEGMEKRLQETLIDEPELSITIDTVLLDENVGLGDYLFIIYEPMNINIEARVVEIIREFDYNLKPIRIAVTLSNLRENATDDITRFSQTAKTVDRLMSGQERLTYSVLPEAIKLATEAIKSAQTELDFTNGLTGIDPDDPNFLTRFTSRGIGVSSDGGNTFPDAIVKGQINTALLAAGLIKTNNIQIVGEDNLFFWDGVALQAISPDDFDKFVKLNSDGLYIAKGAMSIERPDGFVVVNNGIQQNDFTIGGTYPTFTGNSVTVDGRYWSTTQDTPQDCHYFTFNHDARYLKVRVGLYAESETAGSRISIERSGEVLAHRTTYDTDSQSDLAVFGETLTVDLGAPTGDSIGIYVRLKTGVSGNKAYGRIIRIWKEG
jgi:phage minor structural protein